MNKAFTAFLLFLVAITIVRITLLPIDGFAIDIAFWQAWATRLLDVGVTKFYSPEIIANYLPFYYYLLGVESIVYRLFFGDTFYSSQFEIYFKIVTNLFDFATAYYIYQIIKKHSLGWAQIACISYLANPVILFNSTVWGQVDSIPTFFIILATYKLFSTKQAVAGSVAYTLSMLIKPLNLPALPVIALQLLKRFTRKQVIFSTIIVLIITCIIVTPFFPRESIIGVVKHLSSSTNIYPYTSMNAFNFWSLIGFWVPDNTTWLFLTYKQWGMALYSSILIAILFPQLVKKELMKESFIYYSLGLSTLAFFLFFTRIHDRHVYPVFAFLIIAAALYRSVANLAAYSIFAVIHFLNLFYSYYYYQYVHNKPFSTPNIIYDMSVKYHIHLAWITLAMFFIMLIFYYYKMYGTKNITK